MAQRRPLLLRALNAIYEGNAGGKPGGKPGKVAP
jgi:hypothetical protein